MCLRGSSHSEASEGEFPPSEFEKNCNFQTQVGAFCQHLTENRYSFSIKYWLFSCLFLPPFFFLMSLLGIINFWPLKQLGCLRGNFPSKAEKMQFLNSICKIWRISFVNILLKIHYSFPMKYWLLLCLFLPPLHFSFMILAIIMSIPLTFPVLMHLLNFYKLFPLKGRQICLRGEYPLRS